MAKSVKVVVQCESRDQKHLCLQIMPSIDESAHKRPQEKKNQNGKTKQKKERQKESESKRERESEEQRGREKQQKSKGRVRVPGILGMPQTMTDL
jgi:hypothetical protein